MAINRWGHLMRGKPLDFHIDDNIYLRIFFCNSARRFIFRLIELGKYNNSCSHPISEMLINQLLPNSDNEKVKLVKEMYSIYGFNDAVIEDIYDIIDFTEHLQQEEVPA